MTTIFVWVLMTVMDGRTTYSPPVITEESCYELKKVSDGLYRSQAYADKWNKCIRVEIPK